MKFARKLGIDLGTANCLIWEVGKGIVLNEPTVVAVGLEDRKVLAVGSGAREMLGKTPEYIEVVRPMEDGVIADYEVSEAMLKHFLKSVMGPVWFWGPEVVVSVPAGVTTVEQRAVMDAVLAAGARKAYLIDEPLAAAIGAKIPVSEASGNMIVDMGGGVVGVGVISLGGVVVFRSIRTGGAKLDRAIAEYLRKKYNLMVGDLTAESVKRKLGSAIKLKRSETMEVSGRDSVLGLPKNVNLSSDEVYEAIRPLLDQVIEVIRDTLEATPPELVADVADRGIILSGGLALLRNINILITREIGVSAHVALEPEFCVVKGAGMVVENLEVYQRAIR
ncbi:rod shape-determining protein [Candidatus Shapirobacteria bacterium RBG_13_44_7]|uniref:Cell shape-determining protein MreB n=1 Tax=Candidatus Shapirobacteria bacterium RBG_13_44_7 TaxID=1802149 RepID=A0A1F7SF37_9BACT|nr:MAG: rod shape-determining protein [Candidatus Shapirobacteria bacterium RBG_13_44_7]